MSANLFPCRDLLISPDAGDIIISASTRSDESSFGNGQSSWGASSLVVVFWGKFTMHVLSIGAASSHGSQNDPVLQVGGANADRLEKLRDGGGHLSSFLLGCEWRSE
jgi:hypothetical protein